MNHSTLLVFLFCLFFSQSRAEEPTGIRFFNGSWQNVLAEARRQNKPIFVDVYTSWCPPCRRMAREAFPNPTVGAKFNEHFISYQVDAEVGEGAELAKRYAIASYPTALYFIPSGEVVHRGVGYAGLNAMLQQADMVLKMPKVRQARRKRPIVNDTSLPVLSSPTDSVKADSL
ncbi:thioredoxin family protein [Spirosoma sp. KNUC1025]|uniref:thioredoxin family protein n=1 Tax=Spirosoma sp. KNUC1025 TaxID=2894082 RepID=UPI0038666478|nr:thioredoxin family protein [Spirosoma sp. KNUC1025]